MFTRRLNPFETIAAMLLQRLGLGRYLIPALVSASLLGGCDGGSLAELEQQMANGRQALEAGEPEKAEQAFKAVLAIDPAATDAMALRAKALEQLQRWADAYALYQRLIQLHPEDLSAQRAALRLEVEARRVDAVSRRLAVIEQDTRLAMDAAEHAYWRGRLALLTGDASQAATEFDKISPDNSDPHIADWPFYSARAQLALGDPQQLAAGLLDEQLQRQPSHRLALQLKADLKLRSGGIDAATSQYQQLLDQDAGNLAAALRLGLLLRSQGQIQQALAVYQGASEHHPNDPNLALAWGEALAQAKQADALEELARRLDTSSARVEGTKLYLQGMAAELRGDGELAERALSQAASLLNDQARVYLALAQAQLGLGKAEQARLTLDQALAKDPQLLPARLQAIRLDIQQGRTRQAHHALVKLAQANGEDPNVVLLQARLEIVDGQVDAAIRRLAALLDRASDKLPIYLLQAEAYQLQGDTNHAVESYQEALVVDAANEQATTGLARIFAKQGKYDKARELLASLPNGSEQPDTIVERVLIDLQQAGENVSARETAIKRLSQLVENAPKHLSARLNLALQLMAVERFDEALQQLLIAQDLGPNDPLVQQNLGIVYQLGDRPVLAQEHYRRALSGNRALVLPRLGLAEILLTVGKPRDALEQIQAAIKVAPDSIRAFRAGAAANAALKRYRQALAFIDKALVIPAVEKDPSLRAAILSQRGRLLLQQAKLDDAAADFEAALSIAPDLGDAVIGRTDVYRLSGQFAPGIEWLRALLQRRPGDPLLYRLLGILQLQSGQFAAAVDTLNSALKKEPDNLGTRLYLARALDKQDQVGEAIAVLNKVDNPPPAIRFLLASLYGRTDDLPKAIDQYRRLLQLAPDYSPALNNLALLLIQTSGGQSAGGQSSAIDEAVELSRRAHLLDPRSADYLDTLAQCQQASGNNEAALESYQNALKLVPDDASIKQRLEQLRASMAS